MLLRCCRIYNVDAHRCGRPSGRKPCQAAGAGAHQGADQAAHRAAQSPGHGQEAQTHAAAAGAAAAPHSAARMAPHWRLRNHDRCNYHPPLEYICGGQIPGNSHTMISAKSQVQALGLVLMSSHCHACPYTGQAQLSPRLTWSRHRATLIGFPARALLRRRRRRRPAGPDIDGGLRPSRFTTSQLWKLVLERAAAWLDRR